MIFKSCLPSLLDSQSMLFHRTIRINTAAKIVSVILFNSFAAVLDTQARPNQCGFRQRKDYVGQVFTLCLISEHPCEL